MRLFGDCASDSTLARVIRMANKKSASRRGGREADGLAADDFEAEVVGEAGEDGVVVGGLGSELFLRDAFADGPVAFR